MNEKNKENKIVEIILDEQTITRADADLEHERAVAIFDIIEENYFMPIGDNANKCNDEKNEFKLTLAMVEQKLMFNIENEKNNFNVCHILSLSPLRKIVKDYFLICENYYDAIKRDTPSRIETIDMARRGLHDEGARVLQDRLQGKIEMDFDTARRLFTLICFLKQKGVNYARR